MKTVFICTEQSKAARQSDSNEQSVIFQEKKKKNKQTDKPKKDHINKVWENKQNWASKISLCWNTPARGGPVFFSARVESSCVGGIKG